jgi:transglutaminase-like putative cysteine protease
VKVTAFLHDELLDSLPTTCDNRALAAASSATYVIHQDVSYAYTGRIRNLRQRLVIVPRRHHGDQRRVAERFDVRTTGRHATHDMHRRRDRFGNSVVLVDVPEVQSSIHFLARAVVVRDRSDRLTAWTAPSVATTHLTTADHDIRAAAERFRSRRDGTLADALCEFVHGSFTYRNDVTSVRTTAADAWSRREGVCQDMAHVMIAMCSSLGVPSRYVSGHLAGDGASHAWVEVFDEATGSAVAVDPTHARRTDLRYITTAIGQDYRSVAPTSGTYVSRNGRGTLTVRKRIRIADVR